MNEKELLQAALFFDRVRDEIGDREFDRYKDIIIELTADVLDEWRKHGKTAEELFETDEMLMLVDYACSAQELLDTLMLYLRKG